MSHALTRMVSSFPLKMASIGAFRRASSELSVRSVSERERSKEPSSVASRASSASYERGAS